VGAYAVTNALVRAGHPARCEIGEALGPGTIAWLRAAGFASDLAGARFGLIGGRWPGMLDVHLDTNRLARDLGATWEDVVLPGAEAVEPMRLDVLADLGVSTIAGEPPAIDDGCVAASRRLAAALEDASAGLDAMALRCHSDAVGSHPGYGVMGCLGASLLTTRGLPVTCTGDMVTLVAMFFASRVGGAAQYFEVDGPDRDRGALLLSNGGEIDLRSARPGSVQLVEQQFFTGIRGRGLAFRGLVEPGPATLVAFTEQPGGWRLITLEGEVLADHLAGFPVTNAFFRTALDPAEAFRRLGNAGSPHHVALAPGHLGDVAAALSTLSPIEHVAV
jgi:L-fucose isomerase-like protein